MGVMDTVKGSRSSTKERGGWKSKGRSLGGGGGRERGEGRSGEEMNRKDDRSEGYHAHGFHLRAPEHETGRKKKTTCRISVQHKPQLQFTSRRMESAG